MDRGASPYSQQPYEVTRQPKLAFDLARQGKIADAVARLEFFEADHDWETASRLLMAWLASPWNPAGARELVEETATDCAKPELQGLLAWAKEGPNGIPPGIAPLSGGPSADYVSKILQRAGGSEGLEGIEPIHPGRGLTDQGGFLATEDGPALVNFRTCGSGRKHDAPSTLHRNTRFQPLRVLSQSLALGFVSSDPGSGSECSLGARSHRRIDRSGPYRNLHRIQRFRAPRRTRRDRGGSGTVPSTGVCGGGPPDHRFRQERLLVTSSAQGSMPRRDLAALGKPQEAAALIAVARNFPKGFAGFRCYSALTLAEAVGISMPGDETLRNAAFESAHAASHRIQDAPFCRDATAMVNTAARPLLVYGSCLNRG